jgi:hypothetical protein
LAKTPTDEARAQAAFKKKEIQAREGKVALAEYYAAGKAERDKTVKLRELRLAKEAADTRAAQLKAATQPAPKMAGAAKPEKAGTKAAKPTKPAAKAKKRL